MTWCTRASALALGLLVSGVLHVVGAEATAAPKDGYVAYVACGLGPAAKPSHACKETQGKAAYFLSRSRDATYQVCVKYPGKKQRLCASEQDAPQGEKQRVTIATASLGKHQVSWYVEGRKVAGWTFRVTAA